MKNDSSSSGSDSDYDPTDDDATVTDPDGKSESEDTRDSADSVSSSSNNEEEGEKDTPRDDDLDEAGEILTEMQELLDNELKGTKKSVVHKELIKVLDFIREKKTPDIVKLLEADIDIKQKVDLFELYILYHNSEAYSEEYLQYRDALNKLLPLFRKEHAHNKKFKERLKELEKKVDTLDDVSLWASKILDLDTTEKNKETIYKRYTELKNMPKDDEEYGRLDRWVRTVLALPFDTVVQGTIPDSGRIALTRGTTDYLQHVKTELDRRLYGMADVKEQILLFLHIKLQNPDTRGCCLGLIGPCGVGKTSIARSLADILAYPFQQISFGGVNNSDFLKGHHYTYVGARPGEIVNCLVRMKYSNGILFFDEYDKVTKNVDVTSSLLHITDFSQNSGFRDNYLCDIEIDLSRLWFIYSMNELPEDSALRDRIFPIYVKGYNTKDKVQIIIHYLVPKYLVGAGLEKTDIVVSEKVAEYIISKICNEDERGIRTVEKAVKDIIHKVSFMKHHGDSPEFKTFSFRTRQDDMYVFPIHLTTGHVDACLSKFNDHRTGMFTTRSMYI